MSKLYAFVLMLCGLNLFLFQSQWFVGIPFTISGIVVNMIPLYMVFNGKHLAQST